MSWCLPLISLNYAGCSTQIRQAGFTLQFYIERRINALFIILSLAVANIRFNL
jgi:hypothetical protein